MTNIVVIVADDMRYDHLPYMANVRRLIQDRGTTFTNSRCNVALCQSSRVGFFSGQLSLDHGVLDVGFAGSSFTDHDKCVASWAKAGGYRCGLFGKYINGVDDWGGIDAPKGWDTWREITRQTSEEDYDIRLESGAEHETPLGTFQTEYLADEAAKFIQEAKTPWFCYVASKQPHGPFSPHPMDQHAWSDARFEFVEVSDVSAKPPWVKDAPPIGPQDIALLQQGFRGRLRELNAVDRMVETVIDAIEVSGQLADTVIIFTSDNGVHQGEQRRKGDATKAGPYDVGLRVPLVVSGPGFAVGATVTAPVYSSQDLSATVADIADTTPTLPGQHGISLRAIAAEPSAHTQRTLLHETARGFNIPGDGVTTGPDHELGFYKLFRYPSVRKPKAGPRIYEMYDLATDPDELRNIADSPTHRPKRYRLEQILDRLLG